MRPWTLNPEDASKQTPLLSELGCIDAENNGPRSSAQDVSSAAQTIVESSVRGKGICTGTEAFSRPVKRQRLLGKQNVHSETPAIQNRSYVATWRAYVAGNVVSESARLYITNLLLATAGRVDEVSDDSSEDSDDFNYEHPTHAAGDLELIKKTLLGIAAKSEDDGAEGLGRHGTTIRLGRSMWESDPLTEKELAKVREPLFDDGRFPPRNEMEKAAAQAKVNQGDQLAPFKEGISPSCKCQRLQYEERFKVWFDKRNAEEAVPNAQQIEILYAVRDRLLTEVGLFLEGTDLWVRLCGNAADDSREEPLLMFVHGLPGTGKSRVIGWMCSMFSEVMEWEHGVQFACVAFQNKVAHKMGGDTIHSFGDIPIGVQSYDKRLEHIDIDKLFTKQQHLRWLLIDEAPMTPDSLLGTLSDGMQEAAPASSRYSKRRMDKSKRIFGGVNMAFFGDMFQIPPIPASTAVFLPPMTSSKKTESARDILELFWGDGNDSLNAFYELTIQQRVDDAWYDVFLQECRRGALSDEMYNFLIGCPTQHAGSWRLDHPHNLGASCGNVRCAELPTRWYEMALRGCCWEEMVALETCEVCIAERRRRNRLVVPQDPRLVEEPFLNALYVHRNNEPKYHAMLLRAVEIAKRGPEEPRHILWVRAWDKLDNPKEMGNTPQQIEKKRARLLQYHDQRTGGIPGLLPLYLGLRVRVTEKIAKGSKLTILKHESCEVVGWDLHVADRISERGGERLLQYLPYIIYLKFPDATWIVDKRLGPGVFPMSLVTRKWIVNEKTDTTPHREPLTPPLLHKRFFCSPEVSQLAVCDV